MYLVTVDNRILCKSLKEANIIRIAEAGRDYVQLDINYNTQILL